MPGLVLGTLPVLVVKENRTLAKSIGLLFSLFGFSWRKKQDEFGRLYCKMLMIRPGEWVTPFID